MRGSSHKRGIVPKPVLTGFMLTATVMAGSVVWAELLEYPQFRHVSGLPGNGYAVTGEGKVGWEGAMSQCIPLGYTPSSGSVASAFVSGSRYGGLKLGLGGGEVNGSLTTTIGFGRHGRGVSVTAHFVDDEFHLAMHGQAQLLEETNSRPAVSVGVLDWADRREARLGEPDKQGARSFFVAATKRLELGDRDLHVTLGVGSRRFGDGPFAGACYDVHQRVKVMMEYDGLGLNAAAAAQLLPQKRKEGLYPEGHASRPDALTLFFGLANMQYPTLGLSYARSGLF